MGRSAKRLSQIELGERLGFTQGTISRAENGHDLRVSTLVELARALDLELMLIPRRFYNTVEALVEGAPWDRGAVYTGGGIEPYYEGESDEPADRET